MEFTSFDCIEFIHDGNKHIRTYYQTADDGVIRESSFEEGNNWFVRGDGVVSTEARKNSPIAATRWNAGEVTHIRVYFLDDDNNICECQGRHTASKTTWRRAEVLKDGQNPSQPKVAEGSKIAVARPDTNDTMLRIFYQEVKPARNTCHLSEFRYQKYSARDPEFVPETELGEWGVKSILNKKLTCQPGSHIAAVSDRKEREIRVFYHGEEGELMEVIWQRNSRWGEAQEVPAPGELAPNAPIAAVSYHLDDAAMAQDTPQEIRVFTVMAASPQQITQITRSEDDWQSHRTRSIGTLYVDGAGNPSLLAAARGIGAANTSPICVLRQLTRYAIDPLFVPSDFSDSAAKLAAQDKELLPTGLPTSRQMCRHDAWSWPVPLELNSYDFLLCLDDSTSMQANPARRTLEAVARGLFKKIEKVGKDFVLWPYEGSPSAALKTAGNLEDALVNVQSLANSDALTFLENKVLPSLKAKAQQKTLKPTLVVMVSGGELGNVQDFVNALVRFKSELQGFGYKNTRVLFFIVWVGAPQSSSAAINSLKNIPAAKGVVYTTNDSLAFTEQQMGGNLNKSVEEILTPHIKTMLARFKPPPTTNARGTDETPEWQRAVWKLAGLLTGKDQTNTADMSGLSETLSALSLTDDEINDLKGIIATHGSGPPS